MRREIDAFGSSRDGNWQVEATGQPDASGCAHTFSMVVTMMQLDVSRKNGKLRQPGNVKQVDLLTHLAW